MQAYVFLTVFHESNHYIRRYYNFGKYESIIKTPHLVEELTGLNFDGGEIMLLYLFGIHDLYELNLNEAKQILDINNWKCTSILLSIIKKPEEREKESNSIQYMSHKKKERRWNCVILYDTTPKPKQSQH